MPYQLRRARVPVPAGVPCALLCVLQERGRKEQKDVTSAAQPTKQEGAALDSDSGFMQGLNPAEGKWDPRI